MTARALLAIAAALLVAAAAPGLAAAAVDGPPVRAAADTGTAVLRIGGPAATRLKRAGVRIAPRRSRELQVARSTVGAAASVRLRGSLTLRRVGRSAVLRALRLSLRPRRVTLTGSLAGARLTLLTGRPAASSLTLDRRTGRVTLVATTLRLTRPAARRIARRLRVGLPLSGRFARLAVGIPGTSEPGGGAPGPGGGAPGSGGGGPGPGGGTGGGQELPRLVRPATAVAITGATITWHVRDSFIQYMSAGEGTEPGDGATAEPARQGCGSSVPLVYDFHFPFTEGWYDPPSGKAAIYHGGSVRFRYRAHGIDITAAEPEIEIDGSASRAIFRLRDSDGDRRGVLATLRPVETPHAKQCDADPGPGGTTNPQVSADGRTRTYERMRGVIPEGTGDSVFAGYYLPGDEFGWFSVTFTTP